MNKSKPTRTTNKLHFEDLEPHRFEDMGYELLYQLQKWNRIDNWGRSGSDDGIDIYCEDNKRQKWFCQCKRYKEITKEQVQSVVDKIFTNNKNTQGGIILLIIACNISKKVSVFFEHYSLKKGFAETKVWSASTLEAMLWNDHKDLLSKYFDFETEKNKNREKVLQGHKMKREVQKKLLCTINWNHQTLMQIAKEPSLQFKYEKALIRSIDDVDDPYGDDASYWQICFYQLTEVGIEFFDCYWIDFRIAINTNTRCWRKLEDDDKLQENEFDVRADHTVIIPYYSIVDIMEDGDERSEYPVIICDYEFDNTPFLRGYFKNRATKSDFIEGKPVDISSYALLLEEFQRKSLNKSNREKKRHRDMAKE